MKNYGLWWIGMILKKIVNYYWKAEYQNGLIVAVTRIKGKMVLMTEILFPKLKRLHRVNRQKKV